MSACGCDDAGCDSGQKLMPIEDALALLLNSANPVTETETLPLTEAQGRILAEDLSSTIDVPPHNNSAMDGYAVHSADLSGSSEVLLPVSQRIPAGVMGTELQPGTAARIFTGAPIPPGADAVVMQEVCTPEGDGVKITGPVPAGKNVRNAGEDIGVGDSILKAGTKLKPQDIGLAASVGIGGVSVYSACASACFLPVMSYASRAKH